MLKLQEYLNEIRKEFHLRHGFEFGFTENQSEAHFDITTQTAMQYLQGLAMGGKLAELQEMLKNGNTDPQQLPIFQGLIQKITSSFYALTDWDQAQKDKLAQTALAFALAGLKKRFEEGGYTADTAGILKFIGLDSGIMGMMGKMGGLFSKFKK